MPPAWREEGICERASQWPWNSSGATTVDNVVIGGMSVRIRVAVRRVRRQDGMGTASTSGSHLGLMRSSMWQWCRLLRAQRPAHATGGLVRVYGGPRHSYCEVRGRNGATEEVELVPRRAEGELVNGFEVRWDSQGLWIEQHSLKTLSEHDYCSIAARQRPSEPVTSESRH